MSNSPRRVVSVRKYAVTGTLKTPRAFMDAIFGSYPNLVITFTCVAEEDELARRREGELTLSLRVDSVSNMNGGKVRAFLSNEYGAHATHRVEIEDDNVFVYTVIGY